MGRFRIGSKEISLILDGTVQEGELLFENEQNNEAPAKLFVDTDGKLKFRNRGEDPRFIGDGTVTGQTRSIIQGDENGNEISWDEIPVIIWKFKDENGNLWNTSTSTNHSESDARNIILENYI